ncbi:TRIC cation channel family protein [Paracoccus aestuariivivens]|uniref:Trimeric intracellular cation channel family protein n=1 Tax=Paracoccus aestuariivivens TaxID=1820333 RepID=A0A6L6JE68_9RHOB|nr:trimeric intracellular cation channel family protein [Paracoccus aestuariivivens]
MNAQDAVPFLDYASVLVFALTGALVASRAQLDIMGFVFFATFTGIGGGTLRDLLLGQDPVFWVGRPGLLVVTSLAAILVFFTAHLFESRYSLLVWLDALALGVAVPAGVDVAMTAGAGPIVIVAMGVITGTFGGLARDTVANELPLVLKQNELYITATFGGAVTAVALIWLGVSGFWALIVCGITVFALRAGSLLFGWSVPTYRPRPPKTKG